MFTLAPVPSHGGEVSISPSEVLLEGGEHPVADGVAVGGGVDDEPAGRAGEREVGVAGAGQQVGAGLVGVAGGRLAGQRDLGGDVQQDASGSAGGSPRSTASIQSRSSPCAAPYATPDAM